MRLLLLLVAAACTPPPPQPPAPPPGPLPPGVTPQAAALALTLDPDAERFSGVVTHTLALDAETQGWWMHGQDLDVERITVAPPGRVEAVPGTWTAVGDDGLGWVALEAPVGPGEVALRLSWSAPYDTRLSGMFVVEEGGQRFVMAKSESVQSRRVLPGFDEPRFKVPWRVALTVPEGITALANAPLAQREPAGAGMITWSFEPTPPLPTYLLALSAGPFVARPAPALAPSPWRGRPVPLRGWSRPGQDHRLAQALGDTPPLVAWFERTLQQPYPDAKLDLVAAPAWPSGATELAGAFHYRERRLLLDAAPDPGALRAMRSTHAHEIAHAWLGNLVTPPWWDELWLKEGFATWGSVASRAAVFPGDDAVLDALVAGLEARRADRRTSARAVREPIANTADIRNAYDSITYKKGAGVLQMVEAWVGREAFGAAVGAWVAENAGGVVTTEDFVASMSRSLPEPALAAVLRGFLDRSGLPRVTVSVDCGAEPAVAQLTQARSLPLGAETTGAERAWTVPLCLLEPGGARTCAVLPPEGVAVPLSEAGCPAWVHPDPDGASWVDVQMDGAAWAALAQDLPSLPPAAALTAVASAQGAWEAGLLDPAVLMSLFEAAARHPDRRVVAWPLAALPGWRRNLDADGQTALAAWVSAHWGPRLVGAAGDPLLEDALVEALATVGRDRGLRTALAEQARRRLGMDGAPPDPTAVSSDRQALALTVLAQDGGPAALDALVAALTDGGDPGLPPDAAQALGEAGDPHATARLFALAVSGDLDPRDAWSLVAGLAAHPETRSRAWGALPDQLGPLTAALPGQWKRRVASLAGSGCEPADALALGALIGAPGAPRMPGYERVLGQAEEDARLCAAARSALGTGLGDALRARAAAGG